MILFKDMLIDTPYPILDIEDRGDDKDPLTSECTCCRREEWGRNHSTQDIVVVRRWRERSIWAPTSTGPTTAAGSNGVAPSTRTDGRARRTPRMPPTISVQHQVRGVSTSALGTGVGRGRARTSMASGFAASTPHRSSRDSGSRSACASSTKQSPSRTSTCKHLVVPHTILRCAHTH